MELATWQIGGHRDGPHVLITAGVHGDEVMPMIAVRRLGAALGGLDLKGRATLVPVVNEPAFERGRRTGPDDLDLARVCPGRVNGSITEQVGHALAALIRSADAYIDLHTGGVSLEVYPLSGYMLHDDPLVLDCQRRMARLFGLPVVWGTDPHLDGRSLSVARDALVPAIYAEYIGGLGSRPAGVSAYVQGCLNILVDLGMIEGTIVLPDMEPLVVEDNRPNAGFMQIQHRAPVAGLFEPSVVLGQRVGEGELLGTISDALGREVVPILAERTGVVLVLRVVSRVNEGDSLGVILETDSTPPGFLA